MNHEHQSKNGTWLGLAIISFLLLPEHRAHLLGILPYLLLLACPFMHFFMHGHRGKRGNGGG